MLCNEHIWATECREGVAVARRVHWTSRGRRRRCLAVAERVRWASRGRGGWFLLAEVAFCGPDVVLTVHTHWALFGGIRSFLLGQIASHVPTVSPIPSGPGNRCRLEPSP